VRSFAELSKKRASSGWSQQDLPGALVPQVVVGSVGACNVLSHFDGDGNGFFSVVDPRRRVIEVEGTGFHAEHARMLRGWKPVTRLPRSYPKTGIRIASLRQHAQNVTRSSRLDLPADS